MKSFFIEVFLFWTGFFISSYPKINKMVMFLKSPPNLWLSSTLQEKQENVQQHIFAINRNIK